MEYLEQMGLVGPKAGSKPRDICFDEANPALKLFDDDIVPDMERKADGPLPHEPDYDSPDDNEGEDFPLPATENLDGDFAAGEISGI